MEDEETTTTNVNERAEDEALILRRMNISDEPEEYQNTQEWAGFSEVGPGLIAMFRVDTTQSSHHGRMLSILLFGWTIAILWIISSYYGYNMIEAPKYRAICTSPFVLLWIFWRPRFHRYCCAGVNFYFLFMIAYTYAYDFEYDNVFTVMVWAIFGYDNDFTVMVWAIFGCFNGMYWLGHKALRTWERMLRNQEGSPSVLFWERIDKCMVYFLRCVMVLICLAYIATLIFSFGEVIRYSAYSMDMLFLLVMTTITFGSLLYFVVLTLLVRDRPIQPSEFSMNRTQQAIRQARQFVLNPNDPMAEPLLLV